MNSRRLDVLDCAGSQIEVSMLLRFSLWWQRGFIENPLYELIRLSECVRSIQSSTQALEREWRRGFHVFKVVQIKETAAIITYREFLIANSINIRPIECDLKRFRFGTLARHLRIVTAKGAHKFDGFDWIFIVPKGNSQRVPSTKCHRHPSMRRYIIKLL